MIRSKIFKITGFVLSFILSVLVLLPAQYNLHDLIFNTGVEYHPTDVPSSDEETITPGITPETTPGATQSATGEPVNTPSVSATPSQSYYEKYTTPYVGTGTTPKYSRESHHYSISVKYPDTYKVENTLYFKMVLNAQLLHVYRRNSKGEPTEHIRTILVSSGVDKNSCVTPLGKFMILDNNLISSAKSRWMHFTQEWAQYTSRLYYITSQSSTGMTGYNTGFLFHSELYRAADPTRLIVDEFNTLGYPRSHGCIRMQVKDAKWIYENARAGSIVEIVDGVADPATWAALKPALLPTGTDYDPTDPAKPGVSSEPKLYFDDSTPKPAVKPTNIPTIAPTVVPTASPVVTPVATPEPTSEPTPATTPEATILPSESPEATPEGTSDV